MNKAQERRAMAVLRTLLEQDTTMVPVYRGDLKTEEMVEAADDLPAVVIWNEQMRGDGLWFRLTLNPTAVASFVAKAIPRRDKAFFSYCRIFSESFAESQMEMVQKICADLGKMPSAVFGPRLSQEEGEAVVRDVLAAIFSDKGLATPIYLDHIKTEAMANASPDNPLVYLWNEASDAEGRTTFSMSINTGKIAPFVERFFPRASPLFEAIRDAVAKEVDHIVRNTVIETCSAAQAPPSIVFGPEGLGSKSRG